MRCCDRWSKDDTAPLFYTKASSDGDSTRALANYRAFTFLRRHHEKRRRSQAITRLGLSNAPRLRRAKATPENFAAKRYSEASTRVHVSIIGSPGVGDIGWRRRIIARRTHAGLPKPAAGFRPPPRRSSRGSEVNSAYGLRGGKNSGRKRRKPRRSTQPISKRLWTMRP